MLEALLIGGVALVIVNLIVRDQTQFRVSRLRSELMGLISEEKRLAERREEVELMVAQIGDALARADRRRTSLERGCETVGNSVDRLRQELYADGEGS
jgi:replication fork clamp-binding protein CrfC